MDPSSSTRDVCSASSICYLRSSPNHPELATAFPSMPQPGVGAQDPDATVDDDYYSGGAYYYVQAADDDQE